ncbi:hypothetical protein BCF44_103427 [Kutzneria buriramensis]|uniref:Uncharacterized protein n=1 Tax=Kutzneria buriramensis TaxID=1045776 RepID=A0A3E0HZT5_9PSEU|nr:hypothetical protein BCF44_103427 [Kutzneria buriramensis]
MCHARDLEDKNPEQGSNSAGATCKYQASSAVVDVLLTGATGGPSSLPTQVPRTKATAAKLGVPPSRMESAGPMCGFAAQLVTGQVVEVIYTPKLSDPSTTCMLAQVVSSVGLMNTIEGSTAE